MNTEFDIFGDLSRNDWLLLFVMTDRDGRVLRPLAQELRADYLRLCEELRESDILGYLSRSQWLSLHVFCCGETLAPLAQRLGLDYARLKEHVQQ